MREELSMAVMRRSGLGFRLCSSVPVGRTFMRGQKDRFIFSTSRQASRSQLTKQVFRNILVALSALYCDSDERRRKCLRQHPAKL